MSFFCNIVAKILNDPKAKHKFIFLILYDMSYSYIFMLLTITENENDYNSFIKNSVRKKGWRDNEPTNL